MENSESLTKKTTTEAEPLIAAATTTEATANEKTIVKKPPINSSMKGVKSFEEQFQKHFLGPMFKQIEETVGKNSKALGEIEEKLNKEAHAAQMARLASHIPEEIRGSGQTTEAILKELDGLFTSTISKSVDPDNCIRISGSIDKLNEVTCLASSISAYLGTLNNRFSKNTQLKAIADEIYSNVNHWISRLFRFHNANLFFHSNVDFGGVLNICKFAIHTKYENFEEHGYKLFEEKEPLIYVSSASKYAQIEYRKQLCFELGLPLTSIQLVNCCTKMSSMFDQIDLNEFVKQIELDFENKKLPHVLIANAGSYNVGQCDNIQQLERICTHYKIWLHLDGVHLSTLALYSVPTVLQPINSGDSITLDLGNWIGVPSLPYVTLYKDIEDARSFLEKRQNSWDSLIQTLPYWCILQAIGHEGVITRIRHSMSLSKMVSETIGKQRPFLKTIVFKDDPSEQPTTTKKYTFQDLIAKAISMATLVDLNNSIVIFKCNEEYIKETLIKYNPSFDINDENKKLVDEYTSTLTSWLCDLLNSIHKRIRLDLISIKYEGICVRYSPVEHANLLRTDDGDIQEFIKSFEDVLLILDASIKCKAMFENKISLYPNLKSVNIPKWAGIGAVTYIPDYLIDKKYLINDSEEYKLEVNKLNTELVKALQSVDGAFSLGQDADGLYGVKFGMVNEIEALDKLATQVQRTGKVVEESSRFIEIMEGIVRKGIEKANEDLKRENERKLNEEGVLRQIPIVGGLLNWWSPHHGSVTGRAFNLQSGKIETTEAIYKYHMQVQETSEEGMTNMNDSNLTATSSSYSKRSSRRSSQSSIAASIGGGEQKEEPLLQQ